MYKVTRTSLEQKLNKHCCQSRLPITIKNKDQLMNGKTYFPSHFKDFFAAMVNLNLYKLINIIFLITLNVKKGSNVHKKENILILVVDDLRPLLVNWGDKTAHAPNIGGLARTSVVFKNAFVQQALCAPSRNSFLTGRRPDTLHLYDFYNYWRDFSGNFTTIPQFFKELGYMSYSFGKVFHPGKSSNFTDDYPYSWSEKPFHPSTLKYMNAKVCLDKETAKYSRNLVCPVNVDFQPQKTLPDIQTTQAAIAKIKQHQDVYKDTPFFMAVGFHKPHIPLKIPEKYLEFYPLSEMSLPNEPYRPAGMPDVAWNPWTDVRQRDDIQRLNISFPFGHMPDEWTLKIKQSYYAALSYIDDLIGELLRYVDMDKTIVVFTSDHGWSLGEHGEWAKYSNFDVSLKIPLIIHVPGLTNIMQKRVTNNVVELIDIFPTIADLTGNLEKLPQCNKNIKMKTCSEGFSLLPMMRGLKYSNNTSYIWKRPAFSQFPRPGKFPTLTPNSDKPRLKEIKIMGYSIRTKRYRYTEWVAFNNTNFKMDWTDVVAAEFYDHKIDPGENLNLIDRKELKKISRRLSRKLRKGWQE